MWNYEPECEWLISPDARNIRPMFSLPSKNYVYVDLGAAHPSNKSLTSFCRDLGWRGLAIDGNPDYAKDWADAGFGSHFVCAVLSDQPTARFVTHDNCFTSRISDLPEHDHPEKWGIRRIEERSTISLNHLLEVHEIGKIDLLTCDLEGHEAKVLQTLDWQKHQPAWVIAEYVTAEVGVNVEVIQLLLGKSYEIVHVTSSNMIFKRK